MFVLRLLAILFSSVGLSQALYAQHLQEGRWLFTFSRTGGMPVYTQADITRTGNTWSAIFVNDSERLELPAIQFRGDSLFLEMPLFETRFSLHVRQKNKLVGVMSKGTSGARQEWTVVAEHGVNERIPGWNLPAAVNISGRWAMQIRRTNGSWRPAVAEFRQQGNRLTGTIINPSGDYRFLDGVVSGHQMYLTAFDGSHIYAFRANIPTDSTITDGLYFSGNPPGEAFSAVKRIDAGLPESGPVVNMKPGFNRLDFRFPDLDSNLVGINDPGFRGKVTIVQIMGSWCSNCMDETKFLSGFYNSQPSKDVEIVSLAYELSTDFHRSAASLRKFRHRFDVRYPMLITGARSADPEKGAKTLPQLTDIKYFPTLIFIDKQGVVRKVHSGFYGPGAPDYFNAFKKEFFDTIYLLKAE